MLKGNIVTTGELMTNHYLAMNPGNAEETVPGIPTSEPTYGIEALWIKEPVREEAIAKGFPDGHHLIITTSLVDRRRRLFQALKENGMVIDCSVPGGERKAPTLDEA